MFNFTALEFFYLEIFLKHNSSICFILWLFKKKKEFRKQ